MQGDNNYAYMSTYDYINIILVVVAMWRSWLRRQSGNPEVVGSSPAGGESCQLAELSQDRVIRDFLSLAMHFTPPRRLNWVPGIR